MKTDDYHLSLGESLTPELFYKPINQSMMQTITNGLHSMLHAAVPARQNSSVAASDAVRVKRTEGGSDRSPMLLTLGTLFLVLFSAGAASAQNFPTAGLTPGGVIQLPANQPVAENYFVDISHLNFSSEEQMMKSVCNMSGDGYVLRALPHLDKAMLMLEQRAHPTWTCTDWNGLLYAKFSATPLTQATINLTKE
ncbi:MAG: hypothetical protein ACK5W1_10740 [Flavobacteriales bacterium]